MIFNTKLNKLKNELGLSTEDAVNALRERAREIAGEKNISTAYNIYHPDVAPNIKKAFRVGSKQYYTFKDYVDFMSYRYHMASLFQRQHLQHISSEKALDYLDKLKGFIGTPSSEGLELGRALKMIEYMRQHYEIPTEPETLWQLASCCYFTDDEILTQYDPEVNKAKIEEWKRQDSYYDFFFTKPMKDLVNYRNISPEGLKIYLEEAEGEIAQIEDLVLRLTTI